MENSLANLQLFGFYTKCIRIGSGWSELNKAASFYVPYAYDAMSKTSKEEQCQFLTTFYQGDHGHEDNMCPTSLWCMLTVTIAESLGVEVTIYSSDRAVFFLNGTIPSWLPPACLTAGNLTNPSECDFDRLFSEPAPPLVADRVMNVNTIEMLMANGVNNSVMVSLSQHLCSKICSKILERRRPSSVSESYT